MSKKQKMLCPFIPFLIPSLYLIYHSNSQNPIISLIYTALLKKILIPVNYELSCIFNILRPRDNMDFTSLTTAVSIHNKTLKIALGGVIPKSIVVKTSIHEDKESVIKFALKQCRTVDNDVYSRLYRRKMIEVFLNQSFEELLLKVN